tara:strand:- start:10469 stop:10927 length:459 start_codon:yes stop_codon:yes gene_type:complete
MKFTPFKLNSFVLFKIPSAYFSGVRVTSVSATKVSVSVKHRWINQNPFKSMYWATQGMASELATGVLMMQKIASSSEKISMLVVGQKGEFYKKATGRLSFDCFDDGRIDQGIQKSIVSKEGQTILLTSKGVDETGQVVSSFEYQWSVKVKAN